jgi:hypothetical protein
VGEGLPALTLWVQNKLRKRFKQPAVGIVLGDRLFLFDRCEGFILPMAALSCLVRGKRYDIVVYLNLGII